MLVRVWKCADGRLVRIDQMERSHILNCMALIVRKRGWRREWLKYFELELQLRDLKGS